MTALLGLLGSGLGPAGIVAALVAATVAAWVYLGRAGALAVALLGLVLVAYVAGARQATVAADLATAYADTARAMAALAEERRQVTAAASIAAADARRAMAAEDAAEASTNRLRDLEASLTAKADTTCATADDARRLRDL
ncbi:hypothetical protein ASF49_08180 [Methylobacterium sp. Leaf104]|uniref:hypothetical protein n=1 Tax=Methylobacterium TaxID=407 RepID=UPI0006F54DB3|nr:MULTISPECIES: hypothetical protein [Methylobacterium]KQP33835.1 hypothetical protein ASF49_08180 [Methylobacterium sp. Leaf104]MCI9879597.1 hypothetical protein [Methylobacterium goesingense]